MFETWCRWIFYFFLHKIVVYRHFSYFNMASNMAAKGHVTIFLLSLVQMKVLYISNILLEFHSNRLNGSDDTLC